MINKKNNKKPSKETMRRALIEAELRNKKKLKIIYRKEINGPSGVEPTRYGDWEKKGIISDF